MSTSRRDRAAALLAIPPLQTAIERLGRWRGVLVLTYHRVGNSAGQPWERALWSASEAELDAQLDTLAREAEVIDPDRLVESMSAGRGRRVLITFDDGYRDNYEIAFPLLRKHRLRATFFLPTAFLDQSPAAWWDEIPWMVRNAEAAALRDGVVLEEHDLLPADVSLAPDSDSAIRTLTQRYQALPVEEGERFLEQLAQASGCGRCSPSDTEDLWMTWEMAREMHAAGMTIGGHTVSHPLLARLSVERQWEEITNGARRLAEELRVAMRWFAYPIGSREAFSDATRGILRECGVELAFSFYGGLASPARWDPLDVPRTHVGPGLTPRLLKATLSLPRLFTR